MEKVNGWNIEKQKTQSEGDLVVVEDLEGGGGYESAGGCNSWATEASLATAAACGMGGTRHFPTQPVQRGGGGEGPQCNPRKGLVNCPKAGKKGSLLTEHHNR